MRNALLFGMQATALALLATPSPGQDVLEARQGPVWPVVYYYNDVHQQSRMRIERMMVGGVEVEVRIRVTAGPEVITVATDVPGVEIIPEQAEVMDGEHVAIEVRVPLF